MTIGIGDALPETDFVVIGPEGPKTLGAHEFAGQGRVVIFGVPGAFTGTCTNAHMPSFIRTKEAFDAKGVKAVACMSVNDPFVMDAWGDATGAKEAGIEMLADPGAAFTKALGLDFSAPPVGLLDRSKRFSMLVEDGKVVQLNVEDSPGECNISAGEALLEQI